MARRRFRRKDLKRPDEFVSRGRQVLDWGTENVQILSWSAAGIAAAVLLVLGFVSLRNARIRQANEDLSRALTDYNNANYAQAATQLADVASHWPSTAPGRIAGLYAANADLNADNFESATVLLQDVLGTHDWPPYLQQQALVDLGLALEHKADWPGAAARYAQASALAGPYTSSAVLSEARCREQTGEKDKARELYERFAHDFPDAAEAELVAAKLDELRAPS